MGRNYTKEQEVNLSGVRQQRIEEKCCDYSQKDEKRPNFSIRAKLVLPLLIASALNVAWAGMPAIQSVEDCKATLLIDGVNKISRMASSDPANACLNGVLGNWDTKIQDSADIPYSASYDLRRLLTLWQADLRKGPITQEIFCSDYINELLRQQRYAKAIGRLGTKYNQQGSFASLGFQGSRDWDLALKYGLSEGEISALSAYVMQFYDVINRALRSAQPLEPDLALYEDELLSAMKKLPQYNGIVRRGVDLPPEVLATHAPGQVVKYESFTSTAALKDWDAFGSIHLTMTSHHGVDTREFNPAAEEVIFLPGTKFRVLSRKDNPDGTVEISLEEVEEPSS